MLHDFGGKVIKMIQFLPGSLSFGILSLESSHQVVKKPRPHGKVFWLRVSVKFPTDSPQLPPDM